ncbi:MAG: hypothetical protein H8D97_01640 [Proteobacteria bacterium]|nr:hypothetical protein [Pseudomonadota bacterium]
MDITFKDNYKQGRHSHRLRLKANGNHLEFRVLKGNGATQSELMFDKKQIVDMILHLEEYLLMVM